MNSSSEAVEAFVVDVLKRAAIQRHIPWPDDEWAAYGDGGRWEEGAQVVRLLQARKIIAAVCAEAVADPEREAEAWDRGFSDARGYYSGGTTPPNPFRDV